jgi:hypothetical protein
LPYVLGHLEQTFLFFFLFSFDSVKKLGDQQLAVSFSFALHWLLFKDKEKRKMRTAHTLMVPHCEEEYIIRLM